MYLVSMLQPPLNFSSILSLPQEPVTFTMKKADLITGIPDGVLAIFCPVLAYWVYATIFHIIDSYELAEKYRIHPSEEEKSRNKATIRDVLYDVAIQHIIQTVVGYCVYRFDDIPTTGHEFHLMWNLKHNVLPRGVPDMLIWYGYMYGWTILRLSLALFIIDTWQYWLHRTMHMNKTLYRHFHSRHHRLYVPYSYGALFNDPVEGFLLDTAGTGLAAILTALSAREALILYTFATMKTVDDHCGYRFPFDPFQFLFPNNALYHDIHHQNWGFRYNFSQPFFTFWDNVTGTQYKFVSEFRDKQKQITLQKYKFFLEERKQKFLDKASSKLVSVDRESPNTFIDTIKKNQ